MHHFEKLSSASGGFFAPDLYRGAAPGPLDWRLRPSDPLDAIPEKNPAGRPSSDLTSDALRYRKFSPSKLRLSLHCAATWRMGLIY